MHAALQDYSDPQYGGYGYYGGWNKNRNLRQGPAMFGKPMNQGGRYGSQQGARRVKRINHSEDSKKLFVGSLPKGAGKEQLTAYFSKFGEVADAFTVKDPKTGKSRGFGFVQFSDEGSIDKVMSSRPHTLSPPAPKEGEAAGEPKEVVVKRVLNTDRLENSYTSTVVFVGGLKEVHTEDCLKKYFAEFGSVDKVEIAKDRDGKPRRFAMVTFDDYDAVDKVMMVRFHKPEGASVGCKKFLNKEDLGKVEHTREERRFNEHMAHQADFMASQMAQFGGGGGPGRGGPMMMNGGGGGRGPMPPMEPMMGGGGGGGYGDYGHLKAAAASKKRGGVMGAGVNAPGALIGGGGGGSGGVTLAPAERKFLSLLEEANVSRDCINVLMSENLVNPDVLAALTAVELSHIPISIGDRTRLQLVLTSLGYGR